MSILINKKVREFKTMDLEDNKDDREKRSQNTRFLEDFRKEFIHQQTLLDNLKSKLFRNKIISTNVEEFSFSSSPIQQNQTNLNNVSNLNNSHKLNQIKNLKFLSPPSSSRMISDKFTSKTSPVQAKLIKMSECISINPSNKILLNKTFDKKVEFVNSEQIINIPLLDKYKLSSENIFQINTNDKIISIVNKQNEIINYLVESLKKDIKTNTNNENAIEKNNLINQYKSNSEQEEEMLNINSSPSKKIIFSTLLKVKVNTKDNFIYNNKKSPNLFSENFPSQISDPN